MSNSIVKTFFITIISIIIHKFEPTYLLTSKLEQYSKIIKTYPDHPIFVKILKN